VNFISLKKCSRFKFKPKPLFKNWKNNCSLEINNPNILLIESSINILNSNLEPKLNRNIIMQIQINSDRNIDITIDSKNDYKLKTEKKLERFENIISRIEVHLSDENSEKSGLDDKKCLIEARMLNRQPIIVTDSTDVIEKSFASALNKLTRKLDSIVGKMRDH